MSDNKKPEQKTDLISKIIEREKENFKASRYPETCWEFHLVEEMVSMRDGVRLQTMAYIPHTGQERHPVILQRTCYPIFERIMRMHGQELAKRGYAFVYQYCRGKAGSEGIWEPNIHERNDGIDTVTWIYSQPWAGKIGVWGESYGALVGWAMADAVSGKVASMCIGVYGCDRFVSAYQKGSFRQDILTSWTMENAGFPIQADYLESCRYMPQEEVDVSLWGKRIDWYRDYIRNDHLEDVYWQNGWWKQLREIPSKVEIPLYITSGWYDHHHGSTMVTWERLNETAKAHSWLEIGGWNHAGHSCLENKNAKNNEINTIEEMLWWFDLTLVQGRLPEREVRLYEIGKDRWLKIREIADIESDERYFYLKVHGGANCLCDTPSNLTASVTYCYNPQNPVMSHGAESLLKTIGEVGSLRQPKENWREDIVSFATGPLEEELSIWGKIRVVLYVKSDCEDTAFTAKIMEVLPDGQAYNIRSSITTIASDQKDGAQYVPGTPTKVVIEMWDILYTLARGSRIRIDISSSDFPQYNIHSNYAGNWAAQKESRVAHQTILCGEEYPSSVIIPVNNGKQG